MFKMNNEIIKKIKEALNCFDGAEITIAKAKIIEVADGNYDYHADYFDTSVWEWIGCFSIESGMMKGGKEMEEDLMSGKEELFFIRTWSEHTRVEEILHKYKVEYEKLIGPESDAFLYFLKNFKKYEEKNE